ncbi:MAG: polymer-forming cytoskeletal protein [Kiritimatiellae bacterium]|nr:polymer-forming cytoskeletal protein [Kiritimatiellia bacterium]MBQ9344905.1 polymer-forming cytoskeletal protein [Kiritimatiellia bacterium]
MMSEELRESVIGEDVHIVGTVTSNGSLRLDGQLEGDLQCGGTATLGPNSVVKGNISATSVNIEGRLEGNIVASDKIAMGSTAVVNGDIRARRLSVEDGVTFVGRSDVNPNAGTQI